MAEEGNLEGNPVSPQEGAAATTREEKKEAVSWKGAALAASALAALAVAAALLLPSEPSAARETGRRVLDLSQPNQEDLMIRFERGASPLLLVKNPLPEEHALEITNLYAAIPEISGEKKVYKALSIAAGQSTHIDLAVLTKEGAAFDFRCTDCAQNPVGGKIVFWPENVEWRRITFTPDSAAPSVVTYPLSPGKTAKLSLSNASDRPLAVDLRKAGEPPGNSFMIPPHYTLGFHLGELDKPRRFTFYCKNCAFEPVAIHIGG